MRKTVKGDYEKLESAQGQSVMGTKKKVAYLKLSVTVQSLQNLKESLHQPQKLSAWRRSRQRTQKYFTWRIIMLYKNYTSNRSAMKLKAKSVLFFEIDSVSQVLVSGWRSF